MKRTLDLLFSMIGLLLLWPLIVIGWFAASVSTRSNGFFTQERVGVNGKIFKVIKLKTMTDSKKKCSSITALNHRRITETGKILRKTKLDELPQLINVLIGHMSFVGPRPDVPGYADFLRGNDRKLLSLKPGITGIATLYFRNEEELLKCSSNPEKFNDNVIYPLKVKLNIEYSNHSTLLSDIDLIIQTIIGKSIYGNTIIPFSTELECIKKLGEYKC